MSDYKPGTVAVATVRGVKGVRVMRTDGVGGGDTIWLSVENVKHYRGHHAPDVTDIRPLVVLDFGYWTPECPGLVAEWIAKKARGDRDCPSTSAALMVAQEIEEQTAPPKPPRIPEPGLWGVVEAGHDELGAGSRSRFVRIPDESGDGQRWFDSSYMAQLSEWDELIDPILIREGVES